MWTRSGWRSARRSRWLAYDLAIPKRSAAASARAVEMSHTATISTLSSSANTERCSRAMAPQPIRTPVSLLIQYLAGAFAMTIPKLSSYCLEDREIPANRLTRSIQFLRLQIRHGGDLSGWRPQRKGHWSSATCALRTSFNRSLPHLPNH